MFHPKRKFFVEIYPSKTFYSSPYMRSNIPVPTGMFYP